MVVGVANDHRSIRRIATNQADLREPEDVLHLALGEQFAREDVEARIAIGAPHVARLVELAGAQSREDGEAVRPPQRLEGRRPLLDLTLGVLVPGALLQRLQRVDGVRDDRVVDTALLGPRIGHECAFATDAWRKRIGQTARSVWPCPRRWPERLSRRRAVAAADDEDARRRQPGDRDGIGGGARDVDVVPADLGKVERRRGGAVGRDVRDRLAVVAQRVGVVDEAIAAGVEPLQRRRCSERARSSQQDRREKRDPHDAVRPLGEWACQARHEPGKRRRHRCARTDRLARSRMRQLDRVRVQAESLERRSRHTRRHRRSDGRATTGARGSDGCARSRGAARPR